MRHRAAPELGNNGDVLHDGNNGVVIGVALEVSGGQAACQGRRRAVHRSSHLGMQKAWKCLWYVAWPKCALGSRHQAIKSGVMRHCNLVSITVKCARQFDIGGKMKLTFIRAAFAARWPRRRRRP